TGICVHLPGSLEPPLGCREVLAVLACSPQRPQRERLRCHIARLFQDLPRCHVRFDCFLPLPLTFIRPSDIPAQPCRRRSLTRLLGRFRCRLPPVNCFLHLLRSQRRPSLFV